MGLFGKKKEDKDFVFVDKFSVERNTLSKGSGSIEKMFRIIYNF